MTTKKGKGQSARLAAGAAAALTGPAPPPQLELVVRNLAGMVGPLGAGKLVYMTGAFESAMS